MAFGLSRNFADCASLFAEVSEMEKQTDPWGHFSRLAQPSICEARSGARYEYGGSTAKAFSRRQMCAVETCRAVRRACIYYRLRFLRGENSLQGRPVRKNIRRFDD